VIDQLKILIGAIRSIVQALM